MSYKKKWIISTGIIRPFSVLVMFLVVFTLNGDIENTDKPVLGEDDFKLKKQWSISEAENNPFGIVSGIIVSKDGSLCCVDEKFKRIYIFSKDGSFAKAFGKEGEGPGEIKLFRQAVLFNAGDRIAVQDIDKIHFFNWQGDFLESKYNPRSRMPILFLNEFEFITAPRTILAAPEGIAEVNLINIRSNQNKLITKFKMHKTGAIQNSENRSALIAHGITPMLELGIYEKKLIFGISNAYTISVSTLKGEILYNFSLSRKKRFLSRDEKLKPILRSTKGLVQAELIESLSKKLPDFESYYTDIQSHHGLIYIFKSAWIKDNTRQVDIFSPKGKYLYKRIIRIGKEDTITNFPLIINNSLFLIVQGEDDEISIHKYKIELPINKN